MLLPKRIYDSNGFQVFIGGMPFIDDIKKYCTKGTYDEFKKWEKLYCNEGEELYWHDSIKGGMCGWSGMIIVKDNRIVKWSQDLRT